MITDYCTITLTRGQVAIIDCADYERLSRWNWVAQFSDATGSYYARRTGPMVNGRPGKCIHMHREVIGPEAGPHVDHINHNTLDNRRANLRSALPGQNFRNVGIRATNVSGFRGVWINKTNNTWRAAIVVDGTHYNLGTFKTAEEASAAYEAKAKILHGEFYCPPREARQRIAPDVDKSNTERKQRKRVTNTSGYIGVSKDKWSGKYYAVIKYHGKTRRLGGFTNAEMAAEAYLASRRAMDTSS